MFIIHELSDECMWLDSAIGVHLRHIKIINEVDHKLATRWAEVTTRFFLQRLFKDSLHHFWVIKILIRNLLSYEIQNINNIII